jgi:hypothetical protein
MAKDINLIWVCDEAKYFCGKGWTAHSVICPSGKIGRPVRRDKSASQLGSRRNPSARNLYHNLIQID